MSCTTGFLLTKLSWRSGLPSVVLDLVLMLCVDSCGSRPHFLKDRLLLLARGSIISRFLFRAEGAWACSGGIAKPSSESEGSTGVKPSIDKGGKAGLLSPCNSAPSTSVDDASGTIEKAAWVVHVGGDNCPVNLGSISSNTIRSLSSRTLASCSSLKSQQLLGSRFGKSHS